MAGVLFIVQYNCNLFAAEISLAANLISNRAIISDHVFVVKPE